MSHMSHNNINSIAKSATLHCLTGCSIGEIFGFTLSALPLMKAGLTFGAALSLVFAADTLSIAAMELVDNSVMALIPGAMDSGIVSPLYWLSMSAALFAAFLAAYPVNLFLLKRGKGHALMHQYMDNHQMEGHHHA
jgi:hypothetical protein